MVPLLAGFIRQWQEQTPYGQPMDWVFASTSLKGKRPRVANMLLDNDLRPASVKAGLRREGEKVRFGFHNLRHSLARFLVRKRTDVKTVQKMLCHSDVTATLRIYAHSMSEDRLAAQNEMLAAMMTPSNTLTEFTSKYGIVNRSAYPDTYVPHLLTFRTIGIDQRRVKVLSKVRVVELGFLE